MCYINETNRLYLHLNKVWAYYKIYKSKKLRNVVFHARYWLKGLKPYCSTDHSSVMERFCTLEKIEASDNSIV